MMPAVDSPRLTLGVIGHVDHGKTALVRALTGMETDRLAEERQRGLSIVLGFAHLEIEGTNVDLIDVPGHQAFIRAMVAGATGFDGILLVVAANEGVMPQTREHFAIARLLGIERGIVVLTKADTVDAATLARRVDELRAFTEGSGLSAAPALPVSALQGEGIDRLVEAIRELSPRTAPDQAAPAFLPLDRVFTMQGFGVVCTGTLRGGPLRRDDAVTLLPRGLTATVRALQVHGENVEAANAGQRVAVNIRGADIDQVERGNVLSSSSTLRPTSAFDATLEVLPEREKGLRNASVVRVLIGTDDVMARIRVLDAEQIEPGQSGIVQVRCERDVVCLFGERFVIRTDAPSATLGGGSVLATHPDRHRRYDSGIAASLEARARQGVRAVIEQQLSSAPTIAVDLSMIAASLGLSEPQAVALALELGAVTLDGRVVASRGRLDDLRQRICTVLERFHVQHPQRGGMNRAELAAELQLPVGAGALNSAIHQLVGEAAIEAAGAELRLSGFDPLATLDARQRQLAARFLDRARAAGLLGLDLTAEAAHGETVRQLLRVLLDSKQLVRLQSAAAASAIALHADVITAASQAIADEFPYPASFAVKDVRDLLQSSRRSIVPLLEHLDATGVTLRSGDLRRLRISRR
jgi:selenocysteine-specific elongation factor